MGQPRLAGDPVDFMVEILDVQDTPPVFYRLPYSADVSETDAVVSDYDFCVPMNKDANLPHRKYDDRYLKEKKKQSQIFKKTPQNTKNNVIARISNDYCILDTFHNFGTHKFQRHTYIYIFKVFSKFLKVLRNP